MLSLRRIVPVALICFVNAAGAAADNPPARAPQPVAVGAVGIQAGSAPGSQPLTLDATAGVPDIPENQAELEALRRGEMTLEPMGASAPEPAIDAAREACRVAFAAVMTAQDAKIQVLTDRLAAQPGSTASLEIQKEIEREKVATARLLLELQLDLATRDGDQARIDQVKVALAAWDAPRPVLQPIDRPAPANPGR